MKIKEIAKLCKRSGIMMLYKQENGIQWLGDGSTFYPIEDLPELSESVLHAIFDFTEKEKERVLFKRAEKTYINLDDNDQDEIMLDDNLMSIIVTDKIIKPFSTPRGIVFIDTAYLKPLKDITDELQYYVRIAGEGQQYIIAKIGMLVVAAIMPFNAVCKELVDKLDIITSQCIAALENKEQKGANNK